MSLTILTVTIMAGVLAWRLRETTRPVSKRSIIVPALGMSTGFLMFAAPAVRVPWLWGIGALLAGALLLAQPVCSTSTLERGERGITLRRSSAFITIMVALVALRLALHSYVREFVSAQQTAALFFILAFGMVLRWRGEMFLRYKKLIECTT